MPIIEISITQDQYEHLQEEIKYGGRTLLEEETMGGYELILHVGVPNIYSYLEINYVNRIDLGEVEWKFLKKRK